MLSLPIIGKETMKKPLLVAGLTAMVSTVTLANSVDLNNWDHVVDQADGQTVYFHAWGGSQEINNYLKWANTQLQAQYNVSLKHVKVADIAETGAKLLAEKAANNNSGGSVDMVWINGENFKSMKNNDLLFGPFTQSLPNWQHVNLDLPVDSDFSEPTNGLEAPWGVGQLVFIHDKQTLNNPPQTYTELLSYAKAFPGKISYPKPPEFHGSSFLKAVLIELTNNDSRLQQPVEDSEFESITAPLWAYLDELHPNSWRKGSQFPTGTAETLQLLDDRELDLAISFNPNAVFSAQENGSLAESTQSYAMSSGALSNIHFMAIPWNAQSKPGALVAINFLLSPEAQSRKGDLTIWGDPSVLKQSVLTGSAAKTTLHKSVAEPHPSWQVALEQAWLKRYNQ
jgi:putative thiamine transport system substrate-binding protein